MVTVYVEELVDGSDPTSAPMVGPSGIFERESLSSLLYMMDHPPTRDSSIIAQLEQLMDEDVFTDAMGRRLLAVRGDDVDDERIIAAQYLLDHDDLDEDVFTFEQPFLSSRAPSSALGPWLRRLALGLEDTSSPLRLLPGGYIANAADDDDDDDDDEELPDRDDLDEDEDDLEELGEDEDYLDWLGTQLYNYHTGAPCYIIDGVHESGDASGPRYTLVEASTFVSTLTPDDNSSDSVLGTSPNQRPRKSQRLLSRS